MVQVGEGIDWFRWGKSWFGSGGACNTLVQVVEVIACYRWGSHSLVQTWEVIACTGGEVIEFYRWGSHTLVQVGEVITCYSYSLVTGRRSYSLVQVGTS